MKNSISPNYQNLGHQGLGPTSPMVLVKTANGFDLQAGISSIIKKLGLSTTGIPGNYIFHHINLLVQLQIYFMNLKKDPVD